MRAVRFAREHELLLSVRPQYGLPEALHGKTLLAMRGLYAGEHSEGRQVFRPLLEFGNPIAAGAQPVPYTTHQKQLDDLYRKGHRNYWKSDFYDRLSDDLIEAMMAHVGRALFHGGRLRELHGSGRG